MISKSVLHGTPTKGLCLPLLLLLIMALLTGIAIAPAGAAYSEADYVISAAGELKQYKGSDTDVVIPSEVRVIDSSAFSGKQRLSSVVIPEGVIEIRSNAFYNCSSLNFRSPSPLLGARLLPTVTALRRWICRTVWSPSVKTLFMTVTACCRSRFRTAWKNSPKAPSAAATSWRR